MLSIVVLKQQRAFLSREQERTTPVCAAQLGSLLPCDSNGGILGYPEENGTREDHEDNLTEEFCIY